MSPARAELPTAKVAHEQAVTAVQTRDLERAKRGFLLAYIEAPRPILLYNLGVACRDLGQLEEARRYFRRYLSDPQLAPNDPARATAEEELTKLNEVLPPEEVPQPAASIAPAPEAAVCPEPAPALPPAPCEPGPQVDLSAARWRGAALSAGALGIFSLGGGAALFLYSRGENTQAPGTFEDGTWQQRSSDLQTGGVVMMAVGGALTLAGIATWFVVGDETEVAVGLGNARLRTSF